MSAPHGLKFILSMLVLSSVACTSGSAFIGGENERKPPSPAYDGGDQQKNIVEQDIPIANATYYMTITATKGTKLCEGTVHFTFSSGFSLNPTGELKCVMAGDRDLNKMLGDPTGPFLNEDMSQHPEFGRILRRPNPANASSGPTFTPPRPDRIGPLVQRAEDYLIYNAKNPFVEPTFVTYTNRKGQLIEDRGEWTITVHKIHDTITADLYTGPKTYNEVIHWEIGLTGLDKGPKGDIDAFDSMTYYYNTKPIEVPKIVIRSKLKDALPGALSSLGDLLLGGIIIEMNLKEWLPIESAAD